MNEMLFQLMILVKSKSATRLMFLLLPRSYDEVVLMDKKYMGDLEILAVTGDISLWCHKDSSIKA